MTLASARGHAYLSKRKMTIFLGILGHLLKIPRKYLPFNTIESLLEEPVIHELIHEITGGRKTVLSTLGTCYCAV